jgi:hypothetical protein
MSKAKTLTIQFDSVESAESFMSDVSDLIYLLDEEKDADDRRYQGLIPIRSGSPGMVLPSGLALTLIVKFVKRSMDIWLFTDAI